MENFKSDINQVSTINLENLSQDLFESFNDSASLEEYEDDSAFLEKYEQKLERTRMKNRKTAQRREELS